jgi:hypothetical protein
MKDIAAVSWLLIEAVDIAKLANNRQSAAIVGHIFKETGLHVEYCKGFGISIEEMVKTEEQQGE